jgi:hypothetical protein
MKKLLIIFVVLIMSQTLWAPPLTPVPPFITDYMRGLLSKSTASLARTYLEIDPNTNPLDADLVLIAALNPAAGSMYYWSSPTVVALVTTTSFGRAFLTYANEAAFKAGVNLEIGVDVQAYDADLDDLADGSLSGNKVGSGISGSNITTGTIDPNRLGHYDLWDLAYGWGDHSLAGYLTVETDPCFVASDANDITTADKTNWDSAYGWGDHSLVGYLTVETDPELVIHNDTFDHNDIANGATAYGWGDHSAQNYFDMDVNDLDDIPDGTTYKLLTASDSNDLRDGGDTTLHTHNLDNITDGTSYKLLSAVDSNNLRDGGNTVLHYHGADRERANHTGTQLSTTISDFNEAVYNEPNVLTAYTHSQVASGNPHSVTPAELSLVIGTDVEAYDPNLTLFAGLNPDQNDIPYWDSPITMAKFPSTTFGRSLLNKPNAAEAMNILHGIPVINVKGPPYNAIGDDVTDNTVAIQAAADALVAVGGGVLFFPDGTFLSGAVTINKTYRSGLIIQGNGMSSCIKPTGAIDIFTIDGNASNFQGLIVEKLKFDLSEYDARAIVTTGTCGTRGMIRDLYILSNNDSATKSFISLGSLTVVFEFNNIQIKGGNYTGIGISLDGENPNNNTTIVFNGVSISGTNQAIYSVTNPKSLITIINSRLDGNNYGVYFDSLVVFGLNIQNTRFEGNLEAGIFLKGVSADSRMQNVSIQNCYFTGIPNTKFGISTQRILGFDILNNYFNGVAGAVPFSITNTPVDGMRLRSNTLGGSGITGTITNYITRLAYNDITKNQDSFDCKSGTFEYLLASKTVTLTNGAAKTTAFNVPKEKTCVITKVVIHSPSASLAGGTDFDIGSGDNADTWKQTNDLSSMTATTDYMVITSENMKYTLEAEYAAFGIKPITGSTGATTATMEVYGHLF